MRIHGTSAHNTIKLGDKNTVPKEIQILRVGTFNHPVYGKFTIDTATLAEMKANFDANVRGVDVAVDYYHESDQDAAGWFTALELREMGQSLWGLVDWTPTAETKLGERALRYFSPDFAFKWTDPEKGVTYNNVLFGGGLTNRPFVKDMTAIVANEKHLNGGNMTELEKAQAALVAAQAALKLSEEKAADMEKKLAAVPPPPAAGAGDDKVKALEAQITALQAELAKAKGSTEAALAEKAKADAAVKMAEKTSAFNVLLSEGKAVEAQRQAFIDNDTVGFIKLAQPVNLKGQGTSAGGDQTVTAEADVAAILKLADAKQVANPNMDRGVAVSLAKKELKK